MKPTPNRPFGAEETKMEEEQAHELANSKITTKELEKIVGNYDMLDDTDAPHPYEVYEEALELRHEWKEQDKRDAYYGYNTVYYR